MISFTCLPAYLILIVCFASLCPAVAHAGNYHFNESWRWAHFTMASGLPSNRVIQILDGRDGQPWVLTSGGLAWFDGFQWNVIDSAAGLSCDQPMRIAGMLNDSLVIHCGNQLFIGTPRGFRNMTIEHQAATAVGGTLLLLKQGKLEVRPEGQGTLVDEFRTHTILGIWAASNDRAWVSTNDGLFLSDGNSASLKLRITKGAIGISSAAENKKGTGLVSISYPFSRRGLWEWSAGSSPRLVAGERGAVARVLDIGPEGEAIVSYHVDDVRFRRGGKWETVALPPRDITSFRFRANGDLWVGTNRGLFLFNAAPSQWTTARFPSPDPRNSINAIIATRSGDMWFGTSEGLVVRRPDGQLRTITSVLGTRLYVVTGLAEDSHGHIWISSGSSFAGAFRWDGTGWFAGEADAPIDHVHFHAIEKDHRNDLWFVGTREDATRQPPHSPAIYTLTGDSLRAWPGTRGLPDTRVYAFAGVSDHEMWFGTFEGLLSFKNGVWSRFTTQEGLRTDRVFTLAVDRNGRVWFGHATTPTETGLGYIDTDNSVGYLSAADGLVNNHVWDVSADSSGTLWLGTAGGVASYRNGDWTRSDEHSGIPHAAVWPVLSVSGKVYAGTQGGGVAILDRTLPVLPPPRVVAQKAVVEGNSALVRWSAFAFWGELDSDNLLTRYRTDSSGWSGWDLTRSVTLTNLEAGTHTVQIQAQGSWGNISSDGTIVSFSILEPLFLRPYILWPGLALIFLSMFMSVNQIVRKRRHAEELKRSEAKFRAVAELTQSAITIHNAGQILYANSGMELLSGYSLHELERMSFASLIHPDERHRYTESLSRGDPSQHREETRLIRKNGGERWIDLTWGPILFQHTPAFLGTAFDITERKEAEVRIMQQHGRLRELTAEISILEERERRRMAAHLHDVIGQNLALGKMRLRLLEKRQGSPIRPADLRDVREIIEESIRQTRSLTLELSPPILHTLKFSAAIQSLASLMFEKQDIQVSVEHTGSEPDFDEDVRAIVFTALRELFVNIIKHAGATAVTVVLTTLDTTFHAVVADNGNGFAVDQSTGKGYGLFNIRERFAYLGGRVDIQTSSAGSTITVVAPLKQRELVPEPRESEHGDTRSPR